LALGLKVGDEVIVPAFTYIATVEVIALLGLKPVFVDVDYNDFNIDVNRIEEVITEKTKAIVPVHLYGQCANMHEIDLIAKKYNLFLIEDLAQAIGAKIGDQKAGNFSDLGVTSFFPSKNLGCYGDGGAIFTNDEDLADKCRMIVNHGQSKKYYHDMVGVNSRLDTIQAAVLQEKLKMLDQYIQRRNEAASRYDELLKNVEAISTPVRNGYSSHVFHQYTLKVHNGNRDELKQFLSERNIPSMIYYPLAIPQQKAYSNYAAGEIKTSLQLTKEVISLPMHTHLTEDQLTYICDSIKEYLKNN
jgi:dTDP-4-amino-4,6-dideoxygalactose transaminase